MPGVVPCPWGVWQVEILTDTPLPAWRPGPRADSARLRPATQPACGRLPLPAEPGLWLADLSLSVCLSLFLCVP